MHWSPEVVKWTTEDGTADVILWAGQIDERAALAPPAVSYAAKPANEVGVIHLTIRPGGQYQLRGLSSPACLRTAYFLEGSTGAIAGTAVKAGNIFTLAADQDIVFANTGADVAEILVLEGRPIGEPVAQHGPFVMNTQQEIQQAFADYRRTQFGGWPWPEDAMVFPADKPRFSLVGGRETIGPAVSDDYHRFPLGGRVEVHGLEGAKELNGKVGEIVVAPKALAEGRVAVLLDGAAKTNSIRKTNLRRI